LQPHPNNDLHKFPSERGKGIAGTIIIHLVLFLFLIFVGFSVPPPPEIEEGIEVNFGTDETGSGLIEPSPPAMQEETSAPVPVATSEVIKDEALLTQNTEEAPEVKKVDPEAERIKLEKIEADKLHKAELEAERIRKNAEETERKRIAAEQQRQSDIMNRTKNALANSKNAGTSSTSEGITGGAGNQGVVNGSVNSQVRGDGGGTGNGAFEYDLEGRKGQIPLPNYIIQEGGKVVVEITVNQEGKVILANPGIKGSTTLDKDLYKIAKDAALKATFEAKPDAPVVQKGTITYNFILK
jgi:colicin import membrane protein